MNSLMLAQVLNTRLPHRALRIFDLDHCGQECTAVEFRIGEPFAEHLEYRQQPRRAHAAPLLRLRPATIPGVHSCSRRLKKSRISSSFERKLRYSVIFAAPA